MCVYSMIKYFHEILFRKFYSALQALLSAIDPEGVKNNADGKLTSDHITKISERLSELVGPEVVESFKQNRNERGEVWCPTLMS